MKQVLALTESQYPIDSYAELHPIMNSAAAHYKERAEVFETNLQRLNEFGIRRTFHGFYYISHYYPLRAMSEISGQRAKEILSEMAGSTFEVYLHYPFCEQLCSFCHFHKKITNLDNVERRETEVIDTLIAELQLNTQIMGQRIKARSLQLGGGTPSLMTNQSLVRLLRACEKYLDIQAGAEIKIEIYPKHYEESYLREKLKILKNFGFTNLVVDLESGNQKTLYFIQRKNSSLDDYLRLVEICIEEGFTSFITALMAGLPYETYDSMYSTVETLSEIKELSVINVFPTIMRESDPISKKLELHPEAFNDSSTRDTMWLMARMALHDKGFIDGPISYLHRPTVRPEQQADKFECVNLIGFGPSSFGYLNGPHNDWAGQYFNFCSTEEHRKRINEGYPAIWRIGQYDNEERARRKIIFGLANVKTENLFAIEQNYNVSIDKIMGKTLNALHSLDLIELDKSIHGIRFTDQGLARLEEITYYFYSKFAKDKCDEIPDMRDENYKWLINQHYAVTVRREDRLRFEKYEASMSNNFMEKLRY